MGQIVDGRFRVVRVVARGGMGKIYEAVQEPLGRTVALKVMDLGYSEDLDPGFQRRFFLEAATCAGLNHPNTVRVFDYGSSGELYFIVMEFLQGRTLLKVLEDGGALDPLRAVRVVRQIAGSLAEAHQKGIVHRDLKPSNVLLCQHADQDDFVKVLDFGLVKLMRDDAEEFTKAGMFLGSPNYMSPEQIRSAKLDGRSDLYSLGVLFYMSLTGHSPFKRDSSVNVLVAQLEESPPAFDTLAPGLGVPRVLEQIVMCCLEKDPERRFRSAEELQRALKAAEAVIRGEIPRWELQVVDGHVVLPAELTDGTTRHRTPGASFDASGDRASRAGAAPRGTSGPRPLPGARVPPPPPPPPPRVQEERTPETGHGGSGAATHTAVRAAEPSSAGGKPSSLVPVLLAALALLLVVVLIVLTGNDDDAPPPTTVVEEQRPAESGPVRLRSVPTGAAVVRDGVELGRTPLELSVPPGETWSVQVRLDGYVSRVLHLKDGQGGIDAVLSVDERDTARPAPSGGTRAGGEGAPGSPSGRGSASADTNGAGTTESTPAEATPRENTPRPPGSDLRDPWSQ